MAHPRCHDEVVMEGEQLWKTHENIIRAKARINSVVKRVLGIRVLQREGRYLQVEALEAIKEAQALAARSRVGEEP